MGDQPGPIATELVEMFPDTLAALSAGRIDRDRARLIAERTRGLTDPVLRRQVEAMVLPVATAETRTWKHLDYRLRHEVIAADPAGAEERRKQAKKGRRVDPPAPASPGGEDGMAAMSLYGPAEDLTAFWIAIDAAARHTRDTNKTTGNGNGNGNGTGDGGDERTLDQLRFDLLTGLGWTALDTGHLGCCNPACTTTDTSSASGTDAFRSGGTSAEPAGATTPAGWAGGTSGGTTTPTGNTPTADSASTGDPRAERGAGSAGDPRGGPAATAEPAPQPPQARPPSSGRPSPGAAPSPAGRSGPGVAMRLGKRRGKPATVNVTVPISTLAGADNQPGWLDGYGPITADATRQITAKGTLRRMLTDPIDGKLLEYGRTTYAPPAELAAFVVARDRTCRFPTCTRPASEAEIDHKIPYDSGGTTGQTNTWALHKGHHLAKTNHGHTIHTDSAGTTWWTTPAGHTYRVEPEIIGPVLTSPNTTLLVMPATTAQGDDAVADVLEPPPF